MENRSCENCKYFAQHYVKHKRFIMEVKCGHCVKEMAKNKKPRGFDEIHEGCADWQPQKLQKEERRKSIHEALREMEKSLKEIQMILQSDGKRK